MLREWMSRSGPLTWWAIDLKLAPADRRRREEIARNGNTPQKLVPRVRIALLTAE